MQPPSPANSSPNLSPARKGSNASASQAADTALASQSSLELGGIRSIGPAQQDGIHRLSGAFLIRRERLIPGPTQPRQVFDEEEIEQLVASIKERGIKQPLTVRWDASAECYRVIDGGRRFEAATRLLLEELPCWVQQVQGREVLIDQIVHNWQRVDLQPLETAAALARLRDEFGMSQPELVQATGKPKGEISKLLAIHDDVSPAVKKLADASDTTQSPMTKRHLYNLSKLKEEEQLPLANQIQSEKLTALQTERLVSERSLKKPPNIRRSGLAARQKSFHTSLADVVITFRRKDFQAEDVLTVWEEINAQLHSGAA